MLIRPLHKTGGVLFSLLLLLTGCFGGENEPVSPRLLSCGDRVVTVGDYHDALKLAFQGYPYESLSIGAKVAVIKQGVLRQLQEELLLLCVADEKGVGLEEEELEKGVRDAREGYPEGAFERELMSRGISFATWKRRLAIHLQVEKVLKAEFGKAIRLTYDDFLALNEDIKAGLSEEGLVKQVKRVKMEAAYRRWQRSVDAKYSIEVNGELWEKILEEDRP